MKNVMIAFFSILATVSLQGQGIEFFEGSWEEAKVKAAEEDKMIFVDAFAQWCGPCKRMAKQVFTNPSVGEYYNANFVNLKIDMERGMGLSFGKEYPVSAYPTLFFMDASGKVVNKVVGGRDVKGFIDVGRQVIASFDRSGDYAEQYEAGERDYDLVLRYVKALNKANKSSLKVSNDFLRKNPDMAEEQKAQFLFESMTHADSRIFNLFIENRSEIERLMGKEAVAAKIEAACWNTVYNAIEYEIVDLTEEAKAKMAAHCQEQAKSFSREADYEFAKSTDNVPMMSEAALRLAKDELSDNADDLYLLAENLYVYKSIDEVALNAAEKIVSMALNIEEKSEYQVTYAKILVSQGRHKKAGKMLSKALDNAGNEPVLIKEINEMLDLLKEG